MPLLVQHINMCHPDYPNIGLMRVDTDWKLSLFTLYTGEAGALSFGLIIK